MNARRYAILLVFGALPLAPYITSIFAAPEQAEDNPSARIERLIADLGGEDFTTRQAAQKKLAGIGLAAFDQLHAAQSHANLEIAWRARYLVRSMKIPYEQPGDCEVVASILRDYGSVSPAERESRIERLAQLDDLEGVDALTRIVRFEMSMRLSKMAVLHLINTVSIDDGAEANRLHGKLLAGLAGSQRASAAWLRIYADTLLRPRENLLRWSRLIAQEHQQLEQSPGKSSVEIMRGLLRYYAGLLRANGKAAEADTALYRWVTYGQRNTPQIIEAIDYVSFRAAWSVLDQLAEEYAETIRTSAEVKYVLAEAYREKGDAAAAERLAQEAFAIDGDNGREHARLGTLLQKRGLTAWAQREYRHVLEQGPAGAAPYVEAALNLSEMLHDTDDDKAAARTLAELIQQMEIDPNVTQLARQRREPAFIPARRHYFLSLHYAKTGETDKQKEALIEATQLHPDDPDLLIARWRFSVAGEAFQQETDQLIEAATGKSLALIRRAEVFLKAARNARDGDRQEALQYYYAQALNEYAWLVGNTKGDIDQAIEYSKKSLELKPNTGGFYDTLAHCYVRKGDLEAAVKAQRKAAELEPHSGIIARKLAEFEELLRKETRSVSKGALRFTRSRR